MGLKKVMDDNGFRTFFENRIKETRKNLLHEIVKYMNFTEECETDALYTILELIGQDWDEESFKVAVSSSQIMNPEKDPDECHQYIDDIYCTFGNLNRLLNLCRLLGFEDPKDGEQ